MNNLSCQNISKTYGKKLVLSDINLTLQSHRIYGLIGRNGAGKTTLLGILSAQNPASSGSVTYLDQPVWENQTALNEICFSREINPTVMFGADNRKIKALLKVASFVFPYWDKAYADKLVETFELDVKKRLNKLSKGMLSAVTIVVAMASKSPMTFLDEPVAGLDVFMRDRFYKILLEEYLETERTFVVSTHIIDEASAVLEDVIILDQGKILVTENTEELLSRHRILSGKDTDIDTFTKNYHIVHTETLGRSKSVCIEIKDISAFERDVQKYDIDVTQASLQKLFMQLL